MPLSPASMRLKAFRGGVLCDIENELVRYYTRFSAATTVVCGRLPSEASEACLPFPSFLFMVRLCLVLTMVLNRECLRPRVVLRANWLLCSLPLSRPFSSIGLIVPSLGH